MNKVHTSGGGFLLKTLSGKGFLFVESNAYACDLWLYEIYP